MYVCIYVCLCAHDFRLCALRSLRNLRGFGSPVAVGINKTVGFLPTEGGAGNDAPRAVHALNHGAISSAPALPSVGKLTTWTNTGVSKREEERAVMCGLEGARALCNPRWSFGHGLPVYSGHCFCLLMSRNLPRHSESLL